MDASPSEIHALLREVQSDNRQNIYHEPMYQTALSYPRPGLGAINDPRYSNRHRSRQSHAQNRGPLFESRTLHVPDYDTFEAGDPPLDPYDRALQAERRIPISNQMVNARQPSALQSSRPTMDRNRATRQQLPGLSLGQYMMQTPPDRKTSTSSSPPTQISSSPLLEITQRRKVPEPHATAARQPVVSSFPQFAPRQTQAQSKQLSLGHAPPLVQGIRLVASSDLPDRFRLIFSFPLFNAVQSKCYDKVYGSNENVVVSAPTGSGKTAILELAVCRLLFSLKGDLYKIVYMAPTKSLCSERQRDWQAKFSSLGLNCAELTGDTDHSQLRHVQNASIIITTPEKWDSMTRKWKDHARLMQLVKLFLIDEVHILKETRGAILEAVVSRMKSVGSEVRFVALSATVPNSEDIAQWLGRDPSDQHLPAHCERFGEEFRPVKLQKHVHGVSYKGSDFAFEAACDTYFPDIVAKYSHKKPIMVFCFTRKSCISTAKLLANFWATRAPQDRFWPGPTFRIVVQDSDLRSTLPSGVAFHHAGLDLPDRRAIEKGFLEGQIHVICCTSTLAVGVNLPCHLVIIKNTVCFQDDGIKEYADLEIMQMLGRAGRPQYDDSAVAVIITKQEKVHKYEKMMSGEEILESCLHLNLIDHLNAEVGLGTVFDLQSAKKWLGGTFLAVRLHRNPDHYRIEGDAPGCSLDDRIERICQRDLRLLADHDLISPKVNDARIRNTEFGDAMARYYVKFETMKVLLCLEPKSKMSEILSALSQAEEYREVRLKGGEKGLYKELNKGNGIKFPIKVDLALHAHKRSLLLQADLGGVEFPAEERYAKHKRQYNQDKNIVFSHVNRLVRCIVDCHIHLQDAVTVRNALELARSLAARVWDNSPHQMKQLPGIGQVAIRKLAMGGINDIEALEAAEPHRLELLLSKNPPFGQKLLASTRDFPKLRVSVKFMGKNVKPKQPIMVKIRAECGFISDRPPTVFHRRPIYVCLLVERSDGVLVDFRRMSASKLSNGQDILLSAELTSHTQHLTAYVMCDEIAGTMRYAELKLGFPASMFFETSIQPQATLQQAGNGKGRVGRIGSRQTVLSGPAEPRGISEGENFGDEDVNDQDLMEAADAMEFQEVDAYVNEAEKPPRALKHNTGSKRTDSTTHEEAAWNPTQLDNGKWACNHKCKDKTACKHMCCREGVDKPPKPPKLSSAPADTPHERSNNTKQEKIKGDSLPQPSQKPKTARKKASDGKSHEIQVVDMTGPRDDNLYAKFGPRDYKNLHRLHEKVNKPVPTRLLSQSKPTFSYVQGDQPRLSFIGNSKDSHGADRVFSDYGDDWMDDLPSTSVLLRRAAGDDKGLESSITVQAPREAPAEEGIMPTGVEEEEEADLPFEEDISDVEAAMGGLYDSKALSSERLTRRGTTVEDESGDGNSETNSMNGEEEHRRRGLDLATLPIRKISMAGPRKEERLFLSTDSPEKPPSVHKKRHMMADQVDALSTSVEEPPQKRTKPSEVPREIAGSTMRENSPRLSDDSSQTLRATDIGENHLSRLSRLYYKGRQLPTWVKDLDPSFFEWFLKDYADLVELRKIEGVKLGQAVAKDLLKRISPGLGSKAAIRDPIVELDIQGKFLGKDGFTEVASALVSSIDYSGEHGRVVKLEELCLRDNKLDTSCLPALGHVIKSAAWDLRDLDLSHNLISVDTDEDAQVFQDFLGCFAHCYVLRRLDLSSNRLGPKAFEVLTKVYGHEEPIYLTEQGDQSGQNQHDSLSGGNASAEPVPLEKRMRNLSTSSKHAELSGEANGGLMTPQNTHEKSKKERKTPTKTEQESETPSVYHTTCGLRSIPYIVLSNTGITETCALHLSHVVQLHSPPEQLLERVPQAKAGAPMQQLANYDFETQCRGIIYVPNASLGVTGIKVLQLAEAARRCLLDEMDEADVDISPTRRTSQSWSSSAAVSVRRRSGATSGTHDHEGSAMENLMAELERTRHRIQGNTLRDAGALSNELWRTSLKLLCVARALCPSSKTRNPSGIDSEPTATPLKANGIGDSRDMTPAKTPISAPEAPISKPKPMAHRNPNQPLTLRLGQEWRDGKLVLTPISPSPHTPTFPTALPPPTPPPSSPPAPRPKEPEIPYRTALPCGFAADTWRRIAAYAADVEGIMSETQQAAMLEWAMDGKTLSQEIESLGKLKSAQIWRVLDATGCLACEMKI